MTGTMPLFGAPQEALTSDDYYTPAWVFERMGITFDLDVAAPPSGIPWIPATRHLTKLEDGLTADWTGRVFMNPPWSQSTPWVLRFIEHNHGVALLPISKARWFDRLWSVADGIVMPNEGGAWKFASGRSVQFAIFFAAFGADCVEAIANLGRIR